MKLKPRFNLLILLLFILFKTNAQHNFKYQTYTDSVVEDGFYQINLLPSIVVKCKPTLDDIRLFDTENKQVPYLIQNGETTFEHKSQSFNYFLLPNPHIIQIDSSNKISYIKAVFLEKYDIDDLEIYVSGVRFFNRNLIFISKDWESEKFQRSGIISSQHNNSFDYLAFKKTDTLKFTIQNNDNPALKIDSVKAYQTAHAMFAYLKAGKKYKLVFGNDSLSAPVYDISAFSDSIKNAIVLQTGEIFDNQITDNKTIVKNTSLDKIWLWTAIISVLLILLYFTSTLLKQINKKQQTDF